MRLGSIAPLTLLVLALVGCAGGPGAATDPAASGAREQVIVPSVVGQAGDEAAASLAAAELVSAPKWDGGKTIDSPLFEVIDQDPAAGAAVAPGTSVTLTVGAPDLPPHESARVTESLFEVTVARTITQREAHWMVRELVETYPPEGAYIVAINCNVGGTSTVDNRLANGRFAVGSRGASVTGLQPGQHEVELRVGATCP